MAAGAAGASAADGLSLPGGSAGGLQHAAATAGAAAGIGGHAEHSRGDEAFMDHRAAAALDLHRVGNMTGANPLELLIRRLCGFAKGGAP